ncbi:MAG: tRNA (guanosine(37)-N1)-methyltransferase TrmD [Ruminiclostridium sp.]|nr:tRNA (guanosine(37)-N1)-methyltransferase TrmD [Ruminiclostridium sp.]
MIRIDIATLFPAMCEAVLSESIIGRARAAGAVRIACHDIRSYTLNKHRRVDDKPFGGGTGMVMQAQPIYDCVKAIEAELPEGAKPRLIYMSPQGRTLTQSIVKELAAEDSLILLCGHYEGVDARVLEELAFEEISVGDYVVTGGELPALILADAVCRLQDGVLPNEDAYTEESHFGGLLEYPQYTRPEEWRGRRVPEVLLSGHHGNIDKWRHEKSVEVTREKRPDMLANIQHGKINKNG